MKNEILVFTQQRFEIEGRSDQEIALKLWGKYEKDINKSVSAVTCGS